ncbi:hypothetical protein TL18_00005 [Methanobrevibacter sp. YE315]|nr:hypothetical protein TL18_00005 [Methanobrevibacter sp. YE315]
MFLTLILFLTIFSISLVGASENVTYDQNTGELNTLSMSDIDPIEGTLNNVNVDSVDEANNNSLGNASENERNEIDGCLTNNNETQLSNNSNNLKIDGKIITSAVNGKAILGASNDELTNNDDLDLLGATNDEPVLGTVYNFNTGDTINQIFDQIIRCQPGDIIYLNGGVYRQGGYHTVTGRHTIENVRIIGGSQAEPDLVASFEVGDDGNVFDFRGAQYNGNYTTANGYDLVGVTFENLRSSGRMFEFCSGSLTDCVFNNIETNQQMFFLYGCLYNGTVIDPQPITLTNVNFTNCHQTYPGDNGVDDGSGQLGVLFGAKLVGCNFINTSSANHGGAFCLSDEYSGGPQRVASSLTDCNFINITSRWFAVYIHGNYTGSSYISGPQVLDNCKFINCTGTGEYGGALGISHNNVIIRNCDFINNTGGQGSAIMVGGIDRNHDGFWGLNTQGNNITLDNCNFINNVAKTDGQSSSLCIARYHNMVDGGWVEGMPRYDYNQGQYTPNPNGQYYWKHDKDLTFNASGNAAAVYVYGNDTKVFNTVFENNKASNDGGAIYIEGNRTRFVNSTLRNNSAINGTVYIYGHNTTVMTTNFTNNDADNGAGIYIVGRNTYVANSGFYNNTANTTSGLGGALDVIGNNCTLLTVTCINNTASCGGAGFIRGNNTKVNNSIFDGNNATLRGGGLDVYGDHFTANGLDVSDNWAGTDGGAVYVVGNYATFTDVDSINNTAKRGGSTFIRGDHVDVHNCTLNGNNAFDNGTEGSGRGGGLDVAGTNCDIYNLTVSNNHADREGGAIYIKSHNLEIYDIRSVNNTAERGGAVFIEGENVTVRDSIFDNNTASLRGGGLNIYGNNCTVSNVDVSGNKAEEDGGAVYILGNDATIIKVTSINNTAQRGGSTFIEGDRADVHDCILNNNNATIRGGGLDVAGEDCKIYNLNVSGNHADGEGGAMYIRSNDLDIHHIDSENNTAERGGSTFIYGNNTKVHDCTFDGNNASLRGGGLNIYGDNCSVYNVDVSDNRAEEDGGAVYVLGEGASFENVNSVNNTAARGGSTFIRGDGAEVHNCTLDGNTAFFNGTEGTGRGGGLDIAGADCDIYNLTVSDNHADRDGGAIYIKSDGLDIHHIISDNNTAERGGAVFIEGDRITVSHSEFNNNEAIFNDTRNETSGLGGAVDVYGDGCTFYNVTSVNNTAYRGGSTFVRGNNTVVKDCILDNNTATVRGGGINVAGDNCTIDNVSVSNNHAGHMGGAIYVNSNGTKLINVTADNNNAERGGAAFINGTGIQVLGGELNNNRANYNASGKEANLTGLGGAFDIVGDNILVNGLHTNNNTARLGGSTFIRGNNVTVQNCNLDNNTADLRGGALDIGGGEGCQIINVSVSNNRAGTQGGAVYVTGDNALFENVNSTHNHAKEGGSSYINGTGVDVINCNLDNNSADIRGGGLAVTGDNCTFENVALSNCNATEEGGAVYVAGENSVFDNVTSIHNNAKYGGSSYVKGNNITVKNCNLNENWAITDGGGIYVTGSNCNFTNVNLSNCNSTYYGGAIYVNGTNNTFDNVISVNNTAMLGGSTYINGNGNNVTNCNLNSNRANNGGGLYIEGNDCRFENVSLSYNNASEEGGAIYIRGSNILFDNITSIYNNATSAGGSSKIYGDDVTVKNSILTNNNVTKGAGGAVSIDGDNCKFENNNISSNEASGQGGAIHIAGDNAEFSDNNISYNIADFGGAISIDGGADSNFTNNNITFNKARSSGGAVFLESVWGDDAYFTNNNISSNRAEVQGGGIYDHGANLYLDQIYAFNNTANKGGFASIVKLEEDVTLEVTNSIFRDNHALGDIANSSGLGGAFYIAGVQDATIQGDFSWNTAINGSAIYLDQFVAYDGTVTSSTLHVHDSTFYDNQAWSYQLLAIANDHNSSATKYGACNCIPGQCNCPTRKRGTEDEGCGCEANCTCRIIPTIYENENITIIVYHKGGDNIANGIHNNSSTVWVKNITYPFFTEDGQEIDKTVSRDDYITPILEPDYDEIYQYPFENNQQIVRIVVYDENGTVVGNFSADEIVKTDIFGKTTLKLTGLSKGVYYVEAYYNETSYYTAIQNVTKFRVIEPPTVKKLSLNGSSLLGDEVEFTVVVRNTLVDDDGNSTNMTNITATDFFKTAELEFVDYDNKDKWIINRTYYITETVGGETINYTCIEFIYDGVLETGESANFTAKFKTLATGTLVNTVNVTSNQTGDPYSANNTTDVYELLDKLTVNETVYVGDNAEFIVVVTNPFNSTSGDFTNVTNLTDVTIYEIFKTSELEYVGHSNSSWIIESTDTFVDSKGDNYTCIVLKYEDGIIHVNESVNFTITFKTLATGVLINTVNLTTKETKERILVASNKTYAYKLLDKLTVNETVYLGEYSDFVVVVKNTFNNTDGNYTNDTILHDITINEIFRTSELEYINHTNSDMWVIDSVTTFNQTVDGQTVNFTNMVLRYLGTLSFEEAANFTITFKTLATGTLINTVNLTTRETIGKNISASNVTEAIPTTYEVIKIWHDGNNTNNTRPEFIDVELLADGVRVNGTRLDASNNWTHTFTDLEVYNGTQRIIYTVIETTVLNNYIVNVTNSTPGLTIIENTLVTNLTVIKEWNDGNNTTGRRPPSINVTLLADGQAVGSAILNFTNNWMHTFYNLTVFHDNGTAIKYSFEELTVPGYSVAISNSTAYNWTIVNTELVNFTVVKVWNDGNNATGNRPVNVTVRLMNGTVLVRSITLNESNNWNYTFVDLLRYDVDGSVINYSIGEIPVPGFSVEYDDSIAYLVTVTNTELVNFTVVKVWNDGNNATGNRPVNVTVRLMNGTVLVRSITLNESNNWNYTFVDLLRYDVDGSVINYSIGEIPVPGFSVEYDDSIAYLVTVTNTELVNFTVVKVWNDGNNATGNRPVNVTVRLMNGTVLVRSITLNESNNWNYTFVDLLRYDVDGSVINYSIGEIPVPGFSVEYDDSIAYLVTVTNTELVNFTVVKVWNDGNNATGNRPVNVTVRLMNGTVLVRSITLNESNNWNYTFVDLLRYDVDGSVINYSIGEIPVPGFSVEYDDSIAYLVTVTNTELVNFTVVKVWNDGNNATGNRPVNVTVRLMNGTVLVRSITLNESNNWNYTFVDLLRYDVDGSVINYSIGEIPVPGFSVEYDDSIAYLVTVTNTELVNFTVVKVWNDGNNATGNRPVNVTVRLMNGTVLVRSITLNESNNWNYTFVDLLRYDVDGSVINYSIGEIPVPGFSVEYDDSIAYLVTVTNTELVNFTVVKVWNDGNNATGNRPVNVTVRLMNGTVLVRSITLNESNNWNYTFVDLLRYDVDGSVINYSIGEIPVPGFSVEYDDSIAYLVTVTNTELVNFTVVKVWNDGNNATGNRPVNVTVRLMNGTVLVRSITLNESNNWNYTFVDLLRYDVDGSVINYSIGEIPVPGFSVEYDDSIAYLVTVTNTELVNFTVVKVWIDGNNATGNRPVNVTVRLMNGTVLVRSITLNESNNWNYTFVDLLRYDVDGSVINYSIGEIPVPGFSVEYDDSIAYLVTVTNTELVNFTVVKVWNDGNNATGNRPVNVTVRLMNGTVLVRSITLNESNNWNYTFVDLLRYDVDGSVINYSIGEIPVPGFSVEYDDSIAYLVTVTNTELVNFTVVKVWIDGNNATGNRPVNVTVRLMNGTVLVRSITLNESNNWNYTFVDLLRYDVDGSVINYSIGEIPVPGFSVEYDDSIAYLVTVTNTELVNFTVVKVWIDGNNATGNRPVNVTVRLMNGTVLVRSITLNESNNWNYTFVDLLRYDVDGSVINYSIGEIPVPGFSVEYDDSIAYLVTVTNTELVNLTVEKIWLDGILHPNRPANITVVLYADGATFDTAVLNESNNWMHTFYDLIRFNVNGSAIKYTIGEFNVTKYRTVVTNSTAYNWTIINTELVNITVTKVWTDNDNQDGVRPENINVTLYDDGVKVDNVTLDESNNWTHMFENLDMFNADGTLIAYNVTENNVANYTVNITRNNYEFIINNTHVIELINVTVVKVWNDSDNQDGCRTAYVTVRLLANGTEINSTELNVANNWTYAFLDLDKYKNNGTLIVYTIIEDPVAYYNTTITTDGKGNWTVVNTHIPELTNVTVVKVWNDSDNQDGCRTAYVTVRLLANGTEINSTELNVANNWTYAFLDLDKYENNGTLIVYTIIEDPVAYYNTTISSDGKGNWTVVNTHIPELTNVTVVKVWNDSDNQDGCRTAYVTVRLLANGTEINSTELNVANNWTYAFLDLDKYENNGTLIVYTIIEDPVAYYNTTISSDGKGNWTVVNTHIPELTNVTVVKVWNDSDNQDGCRTAYVTVRLLANGTEINSTELNVANNWTYAFLDLDKYENNGTLIVYTIIEDPVAYYNTTISSDGNGNWTVVNTHIPELINITVEKVWTDNDNQDGVRPDNITVHLIKNQTVIDTVVLNDANNWTYAFLDLDKYENNGTLIAYNVTEVEVANYTVNITRNNYEFIINNTHVPELVNVTVVKVWNDSDNQDGCRTAYVTVRLLANGTEINSTELNVANNWTYAFLDLDKYENNGTLIVYTIIEDPVAYYNTTISSDGNGNWTVVNTHIPELTNVTVVKVWNDSDNQDGCRTAYVVVHLLANGTEINSTELNVANNWTYAFLDLDKYENNGTLIVYTIIEDPVAYYNTTISSDGNGNWTVVNTHIPELTNVTVVKVWNDSDNQDGCRTAYVVVHLLANGTEINSTELNVANNWTYAFLDLDKYENNGTLIVYTIIEDPVAYYNTTISSDGNGNWTVVNTHIPELTNVTVVKVWNDSDNQDGCRTAYVTVRLLANGTEINSTELNVANNWTYAFLDLDKYENNGTLIVYTIIEDPVAYYNTTITSDGNGNWTVVNTHIPELINITVVKVWTDNDNQDGVRPANVTVHLIKNQTVIDTVVLNDANNWTFTFLDLDKYENNGTLIVYSINENEVINYTTEITGDNVSFVINNTHVIELINVTVVKVWNDGDNISGERPDEVTVVLLADGDAIDNATLSVSNGWTFIFEGLAKFKHNGTLIKYSIDEVNVGVPGYTTEITNSTPYYWIVNNTYVPDIDKIANESSVYYHDYVKFNITITNIGIGVYNKTLVIVDSLPYGLDYIETVNITGARVIQEGVYDKEARNVTWIITDIAPDTPAVITILVGCYDIGNITNNVTLIGPNGFNKTVEEPVEVKPIVDVAVNKTSDKDVYYIGDVVVWTIKVSNAYNGTNATNVKMADLLPDEFELINYTATVGNYTNGVWTIGFMGNGTEETLVIYSRAVQAVPSVTNYAIVGCAEREWNYTNNVDDATVTVLLLPPPIKEVNETKPFYHDNVTYYLTVVNDGNYSYTDNLTVYDMLPDGLEFLKTIGITGADVVVNTTINAYNNISWVITNIPAHGTAVIEVLVKVNALGNLTNNETIVYPDGSNKTVNCTIEPQPIVDVSVVKTVDTDVYFVGEMVVWTVKVSNAYNGTNATDVKLNENLPDQFELIMYIATKGSYANDVWNIGFMANGTEETLTLYTRAKANGTYTNYVNVTCNETEWNYTNNYDNETVTVFEIPPFKDVNNTRPFYHENVTYYLTATNVGNVTYESELIVIDTLPDGVDYLRTISITGADVVMNATVSGNKVYWVIKNIPAYTTAVITIEAQANAVGVKVNYETIVYPDGSNRTVNATIVVQPIVDVSVVKTVDKPEYLVGDIVVWTVKVSNAYNGTTATDVKLNEALPGHFTLINYTATKGTYANDVWTIGTMGNGTEETLTLYTRALLDGTFTNYVNVTCNETEWNYTNNFDNETVIIKVIPDINKTVNDTTPFTHELVEYYLTVTNTVDIDYTNNLTVIDSLPEGLVYANYYKVDGADLVSFVADGQVLYWTITNISANSSAVITVKVLADKAGNLTNNGTLVPPYGDNITVNCTITPIPRADLEIKKLVSKKVSHYNDRITWTIIVTNNGPDDAVNAVVSDKLPAGIVYYSDDSKGAYDPATGIWKVGDLAKGQSKVLKIDTIVKVTNKTIINFANVTSDTPDPNETNNKCNNSTEVPPEADLILIKDVDKYHAKVGENVTFVIIVTNLGPDDAINTRAYDVLPDGLKFISWNASMGSYDPVTGIWTIGDLKKDEGAYLTIVAQALRTGRFVNEAYAVSDTYDPDLTNNYDYANVTVEEPSEPPVPNTLEKHPTGNPIVMVLLSLLAIVGVATRRKF